MNDEGRNKPKQRASIQDDEVKTVSTKGRRAFFRKVGLIGLGAATIIAGGQEATAGDRNRSRDYNDGDDGNLPDKKRNNTDD